MPELPEVEIMTRQLRKQLRGRQIRAVEVLDAKIKVTNDLARVTIDGVRRRAKYIIFDLSSGQHLLVHLRMTGWFEFIAPKSFRFAIHTNGVSAYFADARRFGVAELLTAALLARRLEGLGPEPLEKGFDLTNLKRTTRPIKVALLDQQLVAGVGNIYASESLWRAKINPRRAANRLKPLESRKLQQGIVAALKKGIGYGDRIFEVQAFAVYDREGKPCQRCGTAIKRITQAQRSTFFCPQCQR